MTDLLLAQWIALMKTLHEISLFMLPLKHHSYEVKTDRSCSKMVFIQCFSGTLICSMLPTWRVSLASSRSVFFLLRSLTGYEPKLMNRDKYTWLRFVKEKLPKSRGNAFGCSARFLHNSNRENLWPQLRLFA